ncbi:hypothetical protein TNCV_3106011 [Trichonephila clavipes]|nr:hypothetical protein TNCV_3106011 [Trichonephila clavipes]
MGNNKSKIYSRKRQYKANRYRNKDSISENEKISTDLNIPTVSESKSVRALVPQKFSVEEELMHVKHVEVKSPHVGVMWKFGMGVISSGIVLVT